MTVDQATSPTVSVAEAATLLGVSQSSLYRAVKNGQIIAIRLGHISRIPRHAIDRLLAEGNTNGHDA